MRIVGRVLVINPQLRCAVRALVDFLPRDRFRDLAVIDQMAIARRPCSVRSRLCRDARYGSAGRTGRQLLGKPDDRPLGNGYRKCGCRAAVRCPGDDSAVGYCEIDGLETTFAVYLQ